MTLEQLYGIAADYGIEIDDFPMRSLRAVALPEGCIAMDRRKFADETEYKCVLAHEIGHCVTQSFYFFDSEPSVREFSERQANFWAVESLVPVNKLRHAIRRGILHPMHLARMFDVTDRIIRVALELYDGF